MDGVRWIKEHTDHLDLQPLIWGYYKSKGWVEMGFYCPNCNRVLGIREGAAKFKPAPAVQGGMDVWCEARCKICGADKIAPSEEMEHKIKQIVERHGSLTGHPAGSHQEALVVPAAKASFLFRQLYNWLFRR